MGGGTGAAASCHESGDVINLRVLLIGTLFMRRPFADGIRDGVHREPIRLPHANRAEADDGAAAAALAGELASAILALSCYGDVYNCNAGPTPAESLADASRPTES